MAFRVSVDNEPFQIHVEEIDGQKQKYLIRYNGLEKVIEAFSSSLSLYTLLVDHQSFDVCISNGQSPPTVYVNGHYFQLGLERNLEMPGRRNLGRKILGPMDIKANMPGKIVKILVNPGDKVESGKPLLVLEAMKMENELFSPYAGLVQTLHIESGQSVEHGQKLLTLVVS